MNTTNSCIAEYNSSCSSKADCTDTYGECRSGKCQCLDGYSYDARTKNCAGLLNAPCSSHELCTIPYSRCLPQLPTAGNRCCTCMQGYHTVNNQCQATHGLGCDLNGLCSDDQTECDVGKSNKCVCRSHHKYDGQTCRPAYGGKCRITSQCVDRYNFCENNICVCAYGYVYNTHLQFCQAEHGSHCHNHADCKAAPSLLVCVDNKCVCQKGYQYHNGACKGSFGMACPNGGHCISGVCNADNRCGCAVNQQFSNTTASCKVLFNGRCYKSADCYDAAAVCTGNICQCAVGFKYDQLLHGCTEINECESSPCTNGGSCVDLLRGYICNCPPLFTGSRCNISTDFCKHAVCRNGGSCRNLETDYICICNQGHTGRHCQVTTPTKVQDLVEIEISVPTHISIDSSEFKSDIGQRLILAADHAYCRKNNLRPECKKLVRRRKKREYNIQHSSSWTVQVDRVERLYGIDIQVVRIFFSVRYDYRQQDPKVVCSLYSLLSPMELAIALGYKVVKHPSVVADSGIGHQLCLLKSVFNGSQIQHLSYSKASLSSRLALAVQTALYIREKVLVNGNVSSADTSYVSSTYQNTSVVIRDVRRFSSNSSIEIVYYAVSDGYCYSAFAISSLLNNLSAEQFNRITLESAIIKAAPYNQSVQKSRVEYQYAFFIIVKMLPNVQLDNILTWKSLEERLTKMIVYVFGLENMATTNTSGSGRPHTAHASGSLTCKLLMADRVEPSSSVRLVLVVKKDNTFVEPTRMVKLLKSADVDVLSVLLKEVIGVPLVCQVYIENDGNTETIKPSTAAVSVQVSVTQPSNSSCESRHHYGMQSKRYWVKTVVKVPLEMSVSNAAFVSQLEKKLTALLKAAFSQKLIKERPSYKPAETERRKRSQFDIPSDICTKVVQVSRLNSSTSLTEVIYYAIKSRQPIRAISLVNMMLSYDIQELAVALSLVIYKKAEVYGQDYSPMLTRTSSGKEFLLVFMENYVEGSRKPDYPMLKVVLVTCGDTVARVVLETPLSDSFNKQVVVYPNRSATVLLPASLMLKGIEQSYKTIRITSSSDITVTAYNQEQMSQDSYTVLPVFNLGLVYHIITYWPSTVQSQFAVVATQGNTRIKIQFLKNKSITVRLNGRVYTSSMDIVLRQYEALQIQSLQDLTGTTVCSDKPVALYSGNICTNIRGLSRDHLSMQLLPEEYNGRSFVVIPYTSSHSAGTIAKILATENNTIVYYPSKDQDIILQHAGESHTLSWSVTDGTEYGEGHFLFSSKPIVVTIFSYSGSSQGLNTLGDPSMSLVPPMSAYQSIYRFSLPSSGKITHHVRIAIDSPEYEGLLLNGEVLSAKTIWYPVLGTSPTIVTATINLVSGTYSLYHRNPYMTFLLHIYGAAMYESYSFEAGSCKTKYNSTYSKGYSTLGKLSFAITTTPTTSTTSTITPITAIPTRTTSPTTTPTTTSATTTPTTTAPTTITSTKPMTTKAPKTRSSSNRKTPVVVRTTPKAATPLSFSTDLHSVGTKTVERRSLLPNSSESATVGAAGFDNSTSESKEILPTLPSTSVHETLPKGAFTEEYWVALTISLPNKTLAQVTSTLEEQLLNRFINALENKSRRSLFALREKRFASKRTFKLQIIECRQLGDGRCDLIFYITQNDLELDAGKVESIYSRLTTASLSTYLADVKVHSAVRVYRTATTIASTTENTSSAHELNTTDGIQESADSDEVVEETVNTSVTGWIVGAVAMVCFLIGAACFIMKFWTNSKEKQTWIQRRLSKDPTLLPPDMLAKSYKRNSSAVSKNKLKIEEDLEADGSFSNDSESGRTRRQSKRAGTSSRRSSDHRRSRVRSLAQSRNSRRNSRRSSRHVSKQSSRHSMGDVSNSSDNSLRQKFNSKHKNHRRSTTKYVKQNSRPVSTKPSVEHELAEQRVSFRTSSRRMSEKGERHSLEDSQDYSSSESREIYVYSKQGTSDDSNNSERYSRRNSRRQTSVSKQQTRQNSFKKFEIPSSSLGSSTSSTPPPRSRKNSLRKSRNESRVKRIKEQRLSKDEELGDAPSMVHGLEDDNVTNKADAPDNSQFQYLSFLDKQRNKEKFRKRSQL